MRLYSSIRTLYFEKVSKTLNCATLPLSKARVYTKQEFKKVGQDLDRILPNFDKNYLSLQKKCRTALNIPRVQMPIIKQDDMDKFDKALRSGSIDIFKPHPGKALKASFSKADWKPMTKKEGEEWIKLGFRDGDIKDDIIKSKWTSMSAEDLLPTQSQIWLEVIINSLIKFGIPKSGHETLTKTIIISKKGYILDGHHRLGQVMLADPKLKMKVLLIPLNIKTLLDVGRTYSAAIGKKPRS